MVKNEKGMPQWLLLLIVIFIGLIPRTIDIINSSGIEIDGFYYAKTGEYVSRGEFGEALKGVFPPFYPFLIGLSHIFFEDLEFSGRFTSLIAGILLILLCYFVIKRIYDEKHAFYMAFFAAIHPYLVRSSIQVLSESTAIFIFTLSIFLFYFGWIEEKSYLLALSGICLGLTYLTRPEYIIYPVPLSFILLSKKRFKDFFIFFLCFLAFSAPYIIYLKVETGLWVISKKAILAKQYHSGETSVHSYFFPVVTFFNCIKNIPYVIYHFFEAISIPFIILCFFGFKSVENRLRILVIILVIFHVLSISLISSSTRRFSFEFIPVVLVFSVCGTVKIENLLEHYRKKKTYFWIIILIVFVASIYQGLIFKNPGRLLHKEAGLFLKAYDEGKNIASRIPLVPFYSKGNFVNIIEELKNIKDCNELIENLTRMEVNYVVIDEVLVKYLKEKGMDIQNSKCFNMPSIAKFQKNEEYVWLLKLKNGR